jgi:hypothetical protein
MGDAFAIKSQYLMLIKFALLFIFLSHWVACAYCLLAQLEADAGDATWQQNDALAIEGALSRYLYAVEVRRSVIFRLGGNRAPTHRRISPRGRRKQHGILSWRRSSANHRRQLTLDASRRGSSQYSPWCSSSGARSRRRRRSRSSGCSRLW